MYKGNNMNFWKTSFLVMLILVFSTSIFGEAAPTKLNALNIVEYITTNYINIFDNTVYRASNLEYYIAGLSGMRMYTSKIMYFGTSAFMEYGGGMYIEAGETFSGTMDFGADISGSDIRMNIALSGVGEDLAMVWKNSSLILNV